jgi:hypothetical protein
VAPCVGITNDAVAKDMNVWIGFLAVFSFNAVLSDESDSLDLVFLLRGMLGLLTVFGAFLLDMNFSAFTFR